VLAELTIRKVMDPQPLSAGADYSEELRALGNTVNSSFRVSTNDNDLLERYDIADLERDSLHQHYEASSGY
jgi:hypothetical protein